VTTTVSQTKQVISQVNISNSPKMYQTISSVTSNVSSTVSAQQKSFLSAVTNAPKLPTATIQLTPQLEDEGVVKIPDAVVVRIPDEDNLFCTIFSLVLVF
jgi:predicted transcriptional regulator YheO